jgi:hypothetical protein
MRKVHLICIAIEFLSVVIVLACLFSSSVLTFVLHLNLKRKKILICFDCSSASSTLKYKLYVNHNKSIVPASLEHSGFPRQPMPLFNPHNNTTTPPKNAPHHALCPRITIIPKKRPLHPKPSHSLIGSLHGVPIISIIPLQNNTMAPKRFYPHLYLPFRSSFLFEPKKSTSRTISAATRFPCSKSRRWLLPFLPVFVTLR